MNWRGVYRSSDGEFVVRADRWWSLADRRNSRRLARSLDDPLTRQKLRIVIGYARDAASRVN